MGRKHNRRKRKKRKVITNLTPNFKAVQFPSLPLTDNEVQELYLKAGHKHQQEFETLLPQVIKLLQKSDPLQVLSTLSIYGLTCGVTKTNVRIKDEPGSLSQSHVELAQALIMTIPENKISHIPTGPDDIQKIWDSLISLGSCFGYKRMSQIDTTSNIKDKALLLTQEHIRLNTQYVRNWGYYKQTIRIIRELYEPLNDIYEKQTGLSATQIITLFEFLIARMEGIINNQRNKLKKVFKCNNIKDTVKTYYDIFPDLRDSPEKLIDIFEKHEMPLKAVKALLLSHSDLSLPDKMTFSIIELSKNLIFDVDKLKKCMPLLSMSYGSLFDRNYEHFFLDNPIWIKPLIRIHEEKYFCSIPQVFFSFSLGILDNLLSGQKHLENVCPERRSRYLEDKISNLMNRAFPNSNSLSKFKWSDGEEEYETDFLLKKDSHLMIIEAKSGSISLPALRGAPKRIKRHIEEQILHPAIQSKRLADKMWEAKINQSELASKLPFNIKEIHNIIRISVTLEDFGNIISNLFILRDAGLFEEDFPIAPTMTLADVETILDLLQTPSEIIHYLLRRCILEGKKMSLMGDELDMLGLYLENGLNMRSVEDEDMKLQLIGMSKSIDQYYEAKDQGINRKKPSLKSTTWWRDIRHRIEKKAPMRWLDAAIALLDFPVDEQNRAEKAFKKIKKKVKKSWMRAGHINSVILIPSKQKSNAIALLAYRQRHKDKRHEFMENIAKKIFAERDAKICLVIGVNIDREEYPYSVLGVFDQDISKHNN